jgi:hypothetical protein
LEYRRYGGTPKHILSGSENAGQKSCGQLAGFVLTIVAEQVSYLPFPYLPGEAANTFHLQVVRSDREGANKQVISSQADSLIKISRIWADFFPANTSNQPI